MIEPIMYVGIGFLLAGLLVIGVIPLVHARAVRLTMRRVEAVTPLSMAEIQADKDQLRAEFAMSTRRLEMSVEQMKAKTTSQLAEIGKKNEAIGRLKLELGEKTAALFALEAKEKTLTDQLRETEQDLAEKSAALEAAEKALAQKEASLGKLNADYHESSVTADSQRVELVALRAQVEVLKGQIESYDQETKELERRLTEQTTESVTLGQQLVEERSKSETLTSRLSDIERQLLAQTTEAEILDRRVAEYQTRFDQQGRLLAEREYAAERLRSEATSASRSESDIRNELAEAENRHHAGTEALRAEIAVLGNQLKHSLDERAKLQQEIGALKREAETNWASERMESAVLRERINDVAAEVARLAIALEGPGSPLETLLAEETGRAKVHAAAGNGSNGNGEAMLASLANGGESKGTLADRIRALQSKAARVPQPS
jgi:chromosome segregation ATPase